MGASAGIAWRPLGATGVHYWLVRRMAKRCGANPAQAFSDGNLSQNEWAAMVHRCRGCDWTQGCQRWLDSSDDIGSPTVPKQCLNADIIARLAKGSLDE